MEGKIKSFLACYFSFFIRFCSVWTAREDLKVFIYIKQGVNRVKKSKMIQDIKEYNIIHPIIHLIIFFGNETL